MRRKTIRGRLWHMGILILIYSCIHVYSDKSTTHSKSAEDLVSSAETNNNHHDRAVLTWRPRRVNCTPPAIEQFPRPLMSPNTRKHGGLIVHVLIATFTFLGLAIVCDDYFVWSLGRLCEELKLSPDVAGATFMAVGSSAPELATAIIGVFIAKDDIGVSGLIGSAVFNFVFVISVCALCSGTVCQLNWWPLVRDCFFYAVSILVMLMIIINDTISWMESLIMLLCYVVYCIALHFNTALERWAHSFNKLPIKLSPKEEQSVTYTNLPETSYTQQQSSAVQDATQQQKPSPNIDQGYNDHDASWDSQPPQAKNPDCYKSREVKLCDMVNPLDKPTEGGIHAKISWFIVYPIYYMCRVTIPDCRTAKYRNWYPFTFIVSLIWISFYSYLMVWMITIIGTTLGIPDTVMGLTFVAAGVSVPDALSSIAVIKEGYGNMAASNAVGSNVFDILICLGLPWFIQTAIINPGSHVNVISKGLVYSTLSLLSTVIFLLFATHLNGWKLDRRLGVVLMFWYFLFITIASLYELNVFGQLNPPECSSLY